MPTRTQFWALRLTVVVCLFLVEFLTVNIRCRYFSKELLCELYGVTAKHPDGLEWLLIM